MLVVPNIRVVLGFGIRVRLIRAGRGALGDNGRGFGAQRVLKGVRLDAGAESLGIGLGPTACGFRVGDLRHQLAYLGAQARDLSLHGRVARDDLAPFLREAQSRLCRLGSGIGTPRPNLGRLELSLELGDGGAQIAVGPAGAGVL